MSFALSKTMAVAGNIIPATQINMMIDAVVVKSADYVITDGGTSADVGGIQTYLVDGGAGGATITLPTAADNTNRKIRVVKTNADAAVVTLDGEGAELVNQYATFTIPYQNTFVEVMCNGTKWIVVDKNFISTLHMQDQKAQNTAGGTATSGARYVRALNTAVENTIAGASLNTGTGVFTLAAGTYEVDAISMFYGVDHIRTWIYNIDDDEDVAYAINARYGGTVSGYSVIPKTKFTIAATKTFRLEYQVTTTNADDGLGLASNLEVERYANVRVEQVA